MDHAITEEPITDEDLRSLEVFAHHATMAGERARLYADLETRHEKLKESQELVVSMQRLAAMGEVAARIAHDIRNPLVAIGGWARRIGASLQNGDQTTLARLELITDQTDRLETMLANILSYSRPRQPAPLPTDIAKLLTETVLLIREAADEAGIDVETQSCDTELTIDIDELQFRQVALNLMRNAVQAITEHHPDGGGRLQIIIRTYGAAVEIEVADNGRGVEEEDLTKLFQPFYTTRSTGTGLGLAICQQIVTDHDGTIEINSPNAFGGTSLIVMLPMARPI